MKRLPAKFFRSANGVEPVLDWLKTLDREDCRIIGRDIKDVLKDTAKGTSKI